MEVWKDIEGYEGLYQVSNLGRVRSLDRVIIRNKQGNFIKKGKIIKPIIHRGYQYVFLSKNNVQKKERIHRLVAQAFVPNPNNFQEVNHKNEDKSDNKVENLEWCNHKYNMKYGTWVERREAKFDRSYCYKPINQYDLSGNYIKSWNSITAAKEELKIIHIIDCCQGKRKTAGGYIWKYK